jgi:hypothetical protein
LSNKHPSPQRKKALGVKKNHSSAKNQKQAATVRATHKTNSKTTKIQLCCFWGARCFPMAGEEIR